MLLSSLPPQDSFLLTPGMSGIDISKPVEMEDMLVRKRVRSMSYTYSEDPPFEVTDVIEAFDMYGYKETYTLLALLLFDLLFSEQSYMELKLTNSQSEIKQFFVLVYRDQQAGLAPFLKIKQKESYESYEYYVQKIQRYPALTDTDLDEDLPTFRYGYSGEHVNGRALWDKSDQIIMTASVASLVRMGELFLNIGNDHNQQLEICLENPLYGVGGVSPQSMEARFWLPGSFAFYTQKIEDLTF